MKTYYVILAVFLPFTLLAAGPETYDHLRDYKLSKTTASGPAVEKVYSADKKLQATAKYSYNKQGQLTEAKYFNDGKPDGYTTYEYNEKGLVIEKTYNKNGAMVEEISYKNLNNDLVSAYTVTDAGGNVMVKWNFKYQGKNLYGGERYSGRERTESFKVASGNNKEVRSIYSIDGEHMSTITRIFNKDGSIQRRIWSSVSGNKEVRYFYDKSRLTEIRFYETQRGETNLVKTHKLEYNNVPAAGSQS